MMYPKLSIIVSTYNASHFLKYAISSVLNSQFSDWEMIVIGDHCTDDTEIVVKHFDDKRIRFTNLAQNSGQQATPSNFALTQANGDYVCYLNQDDMYLPWHLNYMLDTIIAAKADILCARYVTIDRLFEDRGSVAFVASNGPIPKRNRYTPLKWYLASSWFMTAEAAREVGPWRLEKELYVAPSQEWMFRAWRMKKRIVCPEEVSLLLILSGKRSGSYKVRDETLHAAVYQNIICAQNPREELEKALGNGARASGRDLRGALRWGYDSAIGRPSMMFGVHPDTVHRILRFGPRPGGGIRDWQRAVQMKRPDE